MTQRVPIQSIQQIRLSKTLVCFGALVILLLVPVVIFALILPASTPNTAKPASRTSKTPVSASQPNEATPLTSVVARTPLPTNIALSLSEPDLSLRASSYMTPYSFDTSEIRDANDRGAR